MLCHRHVSASFVCDVAIVGASLLLAAPVLSQQSRLSQQDATRFQAKLATITQYGAGATPRTRSRDRRRSPTPRSTRI